MLTVRKFMILGALASAVGLLAVQPAQAQTPSSPFLKFLTLGSVKPTGLSPAAVSYANSDTAANIPRSARPQIGHFREHTRAG